VQTIARVRAEEQGAEKVRFCRPWLEMVANTSQLSHSTIAFRKIKKA